MNRHKKRTEFELGVLVGKREMAKELTLILAGNKGHGLIDQVEALALKTLNETEL